MKQIIIILIAFILYSVNGLAQYSFTGNLSGTMSVGSIMNISVSSGSAQTINSTSQYQNGITISNYASISITSNVAWLTSLKSNATNFTALSGGTSSMPCSIVGFKIGTGGSFTTLSTSSQTVKTGNAGNSSASGNSFNVDLKYNPGFNYPGGIYSLGVVFTITAQ